MEKKAVIFFLAIIGIGAFGQTGEGAKKQKLSDPAVYLKSDLEFLSRIKKLDGDSITFYEAYKHRVDSFAGLVEEEKQLSAAFEASSAKLRYPSPPQKFLFFFKNKKKTNRLEIEKRSKAYSDLVNLNSLYAKIVPLRRQIEDDIHRYGNSAHNRMMRMREKYIKESGQ